MFYNNYQFGGMNIIWWVVWMFLLFWIFATPYSIPGERRKNDSPFDILKKRFAAGQITKEEYDKHKKLLMNDVAQQ
jgi:putative membrane protein